MSNLSKETTDIIEQQAKDYAQKRCDDFEGKKHLHRKTLLMYAHQAGATEWAGKAEVLTEFIEYIINFPPAMSKSAMSEWVEEVRTWGRTALAKYKEVSNG